MSQFVVSTKLRVGRSRSLSAAYTCAFALIASSMAQANGPIAPGDDLWVTPAGGSYDNNPIPAGFFDPGSDPFAGIPLQGRPLNTDQPGLFPIDTIVRRPQPTSPPFGCGSPPEVIPVEIVALSLQSAAPITVTYGGGSPEFWDVEVCLDGPQQQGTMSVAHECNEGGTYQVSIPIDVLLTFTRQSDLLQRTLSSSIVMNSDGYWMHQDPGFGLYTINNGTLFDGDCDGVPESPSIGSSPAANGFFPGMWLTGCNDCAAPALASKKPLNSEQALLAAHGVFPANGDKPAFVNTVACIIPGPTGDTCLDVETSHCSQRGGTPGGPVCQPPPIQYENWVIADDFNIACPACQCDFNFDGNCQFNDLAFMTDCINNGGGPNCDQADLNCDGVVSVADTAIWNCLFSGGAPQNCCSNQNRPKITRVRWYGSYFDPEFEPPMNVRDVDAWLIGLHSDVPPQACPAPPPGTKPLDLCGTLTLCATGDWLFTPKGSSFSYNLADVNSLLSGASAGDMVRICGHFDDIIASPCPIGIDTVVVNDVLPCDSAVSKPSKLLAQWGVDPANVTIDDTGKVGWDGHKIYCYTADLPEGCLLHNYTTAGEVDASKRICPLNNRTYWLSIQASEGHALTMNPDGTCTEIATNDPPVTQDFWGWHTTPPGHQRLDDAYMGVLHMAVDPNDPTGCEHSWVYNWMSHLHCSDPRYKDCCDDPTKSIDMAFYLIDAKGFCGSTNQPCTSDGDCSGGDTCNFTEQVRWCQPVNPGPPTPPFPPIPPLPPGNPDELKETVADAIISLDGLPPGEPVIGMVGPTVIKRGIEHEDIGAPVDIIETEIIALDLVGSSPALGPVRITLNPDNSSPGQSIRPKGQFQVDSFFDVWVEVSVGSQPQLITTVPIRVQALHYEIPPGNIQFVGPVGGPVQLVERGTGTPRGTLDQIVHFVPYNGGVNIHSDVDWPSSPMNDCCEPNDAGTACEPVICPNPNEQCVATKIESQCAFTCTLSGAACVTDADCPVAGETCQLNGTCTTVITECDCRGPVPVCHGEPAPAGVFPPVVCVDPCPNPLLSCELFGLDTDGDGIDDDWRCDCDPVQDPTGLCCDANGNCFVTTAAGCPVPPNAGFHPGASCTGQRACCLPNDTCADLEPVCCEDLGGTVIFGTNCAGTIEACCFNDGTCQDLDPVCCQHQMGTPGGAGSACQGDNDGNMIDDGCECSPDPNSPGCSGPCPGPVPPTEECVARCVKIDPATGLVDATDCDCIDPALCHVAGTVLGGGAPAPSVVAGPGGNPCVVVDDGSGTITLPPDGCEYLSPDDVHMIIDGLPVTVPPTTIELGIAHKGFFCSACNGGANNGAPCDSDADCPGGLCRPDVNSTCSFNFDAGCDQSGGGLGGEQECSKSALEMQINGTGLLGGFNRFITMQVEFETQTGPKNEGDPVQSFPTEMVRLQGQLFGDPDFCQLVMTAGTDFGLPSPGHTTLTRLGPPGSSFQVDSFFDIEYRIDFQGCPGSALDGYSGSTTGTIRMATGAGDVKCEGDCPPGQVCQETRVVQADGTVDLCCECVDEVCRPDPDGPGCVGPCPSPAVEECLPRCVIIDPLTGVIDASLCDCVDHAECHVTGVVPGGGAAPSVVAGAGGNPCIIPDDFSGTVTLPPPGCEYLSPEEVHEIIDGLPAGTTIELGAIHKDFICRKQNAVCTFPLGVDCDQAGGSLGGSQECASSVLDLQVQGTGTLSGFNRTLTLPIDFETHTGPRVIGDPIQSFDTDMFRLRGDLFGDPDFCQLSMTAGTDFGLPSPGHTTLIQLPSGDWTVDSFFDIEYRIDYQGCPGGPLNGVVGSTTGTIRMSTGAGQATCEGTCPPGQQCQETHVVNPDGTVELCCDCVEDVCDISMDMTDCVGSCPIAGEVCAPECVVIDPLTGELTVQGCDCYGDECHVDLPNSAGAAGVVAGPGGGNPCTVIDNGSGTIELPPPGCEYLSPEEVHEIVDGLPGGATIELAAIHKNFICNKQDSACAGPPLVCEEPGGNLGGKIECFTSDLELQMNGTGVLSTFNKNVTIQTTCQAHTSPIPKDQAEQTFQNEMFSLQGDIAGGDPDFSLLRITAGAAFGLPPSVGETTLTRLGPPGSSFVVDSFFDIDYRIDWVGAPGGPLDGMFGTNTGTLRMSTGGQPQCVGSCPAGEVCVREKTVQADGKVQVCCRCEPEVCEPTPDGLACEDIICPTPGEVCVPQQVKCTGNGCRVTVCDCQPPNDCHVDMPLPGTNTPICVGGCPSVNQRCVRFVKDLDSDGLPQEHFCKCVKKLPPIVIDSTAVHNRFLSIDLGGPLAARDGGSRDVKSGGSKGDVHARGGDSAAIRVKISNAPQFPASNGNEYWVGVPGEVCDDSATVIPPCSFGSFTSAELKCDPLFMDWTTTTSLSIRGPDIVPGPTTYVVQWVDSSCEDLTVEECYSDPVLLDTRKYGDVVMPFGGINQPNFADITAVVDRFKDAAVAIPKADTDLGGHVLDLKVNFLDITLDVDAFKGFPYPYSGPCTCPSSATCPVLDACGRCTNP